MKKSPNPTIPMITEKPPEQIRVGENSYRLRIFKPLQAVWGNVVLVYVNQTAVFAMVNGASEDECRGKMVKGLAHQRIEG